MTKDPCPRCGGSMFSENRPAPCPDNIDEYGIYHPSAYGCAVAHFKTIFKCKECEREYTLDDR